MKQTSIVLACNVIMLCLLLSCARLDRNKIDLTISENEQYYTIIADFNKRQTTAVDNYLDEHLDKKASMSFTNTRIDAYLTLDNNMKLYVKKYPGYLKIKFNKDENSGASYAVIKQLGEGLKPVINNQQ